MKPLALLALLLDALSAAQAPLDTRAAGAYVRGVMGRAGLSGAAVEVVRGDSIAFAPGAEAVLKALLRSAEAAPAGALAPPAA